MADVAQSEYAALRAATTGQMIPLDEHRSLLAEKDAIIAGLSAKVAERDRAIADLRSKLGLPPAVISDISPTASSDRRAAFAQKWAAGVTLDSDSGSGSESSYSDHEIPAVRLGPAIAEHRGRMSGSVVGNETDVHNASYDEYIVMVASRLHHMWRETRLRDDGTYEPRPKLVLDVTYDIANLDYVHLPEKFKEENRAAAEVACQSVKCVVKDFHRPPPDAFSKVFIEDAAKDQHDTWMDRNREWADPALMIPYDDLPEEEKEKDRIIVKEAIRLYKVWCVTMATRRTAAARKSAQEAMGAWPPASAQSSPHDLGALLRARGAKKAGMAAATSTA